ncbi:A/G-specific adenine glycosylase [Leptospira sp. 96542]|nr:A/G-specific adenine glycosylase [Leptospira sp. 96542]
MNPNQKLYHWYQIHKRDLPFRKKKLAYQIWVSEVMLQQTRVAAMLPLYENFIQSFPTIEDLANSDETAVLTAWKGLGYYQRARNLRKGAIYLVQNYNGQFPKDLESVLKIPGIGSYTARAILSITYDLPFAVLDGNVKRVLARLFGYQNNILGSVADKELQRIADGFLNLSSPGDHNQAMMELGATLCLPESPKCLVCPIQEYCKSNLEKTTDRIPLRKKNETKISLQGKIFWLENKNQILLVKEKKERFLKGFFHTPFGFFETGVLPAYTPSPFMESIARMAEESEFLSNFKHTITHHSLLFGVWKMEVGVREKLETICFQNEVEYKWVDISKLEDEFPSSIAKKIIKIVLY